MRGGAQRWSRGGCRSAMKVKQLWGQLWGWNQVTSRCRGRNDRVDVGGTCSISSCRDQNKHADNTSRIKMTTMAVHATPQDESTDDGRCPVETWRWWGNGQESPSRLGPGGFSWSNKLPLAFSHCSSLPPSQPGQATREVPCKAENRTKMQDSGVCFSEGRR